MKNPNGFEKENLYSIMFDRSVRAGRIFDLALIVAISFEYHHPL